MLAVTNLVTTYGNIEALKGVTIAAHRGEVTCLLGPNGAGKTTLMMTIAGILRPRAGSIRVGDTEIAGRSSSAIVSAGIALVPENRLVFPQMSVRDNLLAGAYLRKDSKGIAGDLDRIVARFPILRERSNQDAGLLSGGEQQMLAVGRALMSRPKLLLMDEPSIGLAPRMVEQIFRIVADLNREGLTIFLMEQNVRMALKVAHQFHLIEQGRITFSGKPGALADDAVIRRAYLGSTPAR
jgi:branched-chain amino acid transport system ATP-binding protein